MKCEESINIGTMYCIFAIMQVLAKMSKILQRSTFFYRVFVWLWLVIVAYLSLTEQQGLPSVDINHIDKLFHIMAYSLATTVSLVSYPKIKQLYIVLFLIAFSFAIEVGQLYVENRFFEFLDLGANIVGILMALFFTNRFIIRRG